MDRMTRAVPHGTRVHLVIHTTSGVEFQLVPDKDGEPDLDRPPITGRMYACEEGDDEAEDEAREALLRMMRERGMILVAEAWS